MYVIQTELCPRGSHKSGRRICEIS